MECCVCFELYDSLQHAPLVLLCGHSLCADCAQKLPKPLECPNDRQPDTRNLSDIPRNYALMEVAAIVKQQHKQQQQASRAGAAPAEGDSSRSTTTDNNNSNSLKSFSGVDTTQLHISHVLLGKSSGGVASVLEGTYRGDKVAVKVVDLLCVPPAARQTLLTESTELLSTLESAAASTHTCHYHGVCLRGDQLLVVMKQYSKSLAGVLAEQAGARLPFASLLHHCCQVLTVLAGLHSNGIAAGDLKPSNLLLEEVAQEGQQQHQQHQQQRLVLADADLHIRMARALGDMWPTEPALADPYYKSPEYYTLDWSGPSQFRHAASDMWSFACIALHMATGKPPLSHLSKERVVALVGMQKRLLLDTLTTTLPADLPAELQQLLQACLSPGPEARPTAAAALQVVRRLEAQRLQAVQLQTQLPQNPAAATTPAALGREKQPAVDQAAAAAAAAGAHPADAQAVAHPAAHAPAAAQHSMGQSAASQGHAAAAGSDDSAITNALRGLIAPHGSSSTGDIGGQPGQATGLGTAAATMNGGQRGSSSGDGASSNSSHELQSLRVPARVSLDRGSSSSSSNAGGSRALQHHPSTASSSSRMTRSPGSPSQAAPEYGHSSSSSRGFIGPMRGAGGPMAAPGNAGSTAGGSRLGGPAPATASTAGSNNNNSSHRAAGMSSSSSHRGSREPISRSWAPSGSESSSWRSTPAAAPTADTRSNSSSSSRSVQSFHALLRDVQGSNEQRANQAAHQLGQLELTRNEWELVAAAVAETVRALPEAARPLGEADAAVIAVMTRLAKARPDATVPPLVDMIGSDQPRHVEVALEVLLAVTATDAAAAGMLVRQPDSIRVLLGDWSTDDRVLTAAAALVANMPGIQVSDDSAIARLIYALEKREGSSDHLREAAAKAVHHLVSAAPGNAKAFATAPNPNALQRLVQLMADGTPAAQADAAEAAAVLVPWTRMAGQPKGYAALDKQWSSYMQDYVPALVQMLQRPHQATQYVAAEVLWHMCSWESGCNSRDLLNTIPDSVPTLAQLLHSNSWQVARAAAGVLGSLWADAVLDVPGVVGQLVGLLGNAQVHVKVQVQAACCIHNLVTAPNNAHVAHQAVLAVPDALQRLETCARGKHNELQTFAAKVLRQL